MLKQDTFFHVISQIFKHEIEGRKSTAFRSDRKSEMNYVNRPIRQKQYISAKFHFLYYIAVKKCHGGYLYHLGVSLDVLEIFWDALSTYLMILPKPVVVLYMTKYQKSVAEFRACNLHGEFFAQLQRQNHLEFTDKTQITTCKQVHAFMKYQVR